MECPPNSHYEVCADTCSLGCSALSAPPQCPESCAEGCQCDPGFLNDGLACVPIQQCGCYHNGIYYEVGTLSLWAEPRALHQNPIHCPSPHSPPLGLLNVSPTHPFPSSWPHCCPICHLLLPPHPHFSPLGHLPHGSGKTSQYGHGPYNFKPFPDSAGLDHL